MEVEVAYARPDKQQIVPVVVPPGTTALEAVKPLQDYRDLSGD